MNINKEEFINYLINEIRCLKNRYNEIMTQRNRLDDTLSRIEAKIGFGEMILEKYKKIVGDN